MSHWRVAAAQSGSFPADPERNIAHHLQFIRQAADHRVDLLLFPELSLTGYDLEQARAAALNLDDPRLDCFSAAASEHQMSIIIGLPVQREGNAHVAAVAFLPEGTRVAYAKRQLHGDEALFFTPGDGLPLFGYDHRYVALAICADISVESYARNAAQRGANLYAAGVLISEQGYATDTGYLQRWSQSCKMAVLMANHALPTGGLSTAGRSAFWNEQGQLVVAAGEGELLVIAERQQASWKGEVVPLQRPEIV